MSTRILLNILSKSYCQIFSLKMGGLNKYQFDSLKKFKKGHIEESIYNIGTSLIIHMCFLIVEI